MSENTVKLPEQSKTGWPPGMLQDDDRSLSKWLANRIDSLRHAKDAAAAIRELGKEKPE